MPGAGTWIKMFGVGAVMCIGGPALVYYVTPTEEELFKKYNPDLQRRSLQNRQQRQQDFDDFVTKLKGYSKSEKPIWEVAAEDDARQREAARLGDIEAQRSLAADVERRREEIRRHSKT